MSWEDHTHTEVDALEYDVSSLRRKVDELNRLNSQLQYELHEADGELHRELDETSSDLSDELTEISRAVSLLASRVEWLEGFVRRSGKVDVVDLDEADAESKKLAADAERGRHVRSQQMSDFNRGHLQSVVSSHAEARRRHREHRKEVLSLSADLASTPITSPAHVQAAEQYEAAASRLENAKATVDGSVSAAKEARGKLIEDNATRATAAPLIEAGDEAQQQLFARLTWRLSDALDRGAMMPDWFKGDFGPTRPTDGTQEWMDTAIEVLAFRLTYGITDPAVALGPPPPEEHAQHRRDWYQDLDRRLATLRE